MAPALARQRLKQAATAGDARGMVAYGWLLANGIGAVTVDADGNLSIAYNTPTVTSMAIDASGNLSVTYPS